MSEAIATAHQPPSTLVVLGVDSDGKPHASRFTGVDQALVGKAAQMMKMHVVQVEDEALQRIAAELPEGKIFATGRGLVPFVRRGLYDKLAELIGTRSELKPVPADALSTVVPVPTTSEKASVGKLAAVTSGPDAKGQKSAEHQGATDDSQAEADLWATIKVGSVVLARSPDPEEGWFEAVVLTVASEDQNAMRLRWRDFPNEPQFQMHRHRLALTAPGVR